MCALAAVILAAGKGTRMKSKYPKVLHSIAGRPMISYPIQRARELDADPIVVVVGHEAQSVRQAIAEDDLRWVVQEPQLGTGHAVQCAQASLGGFTGQVLIMCGDVPLLELDTLRKMIEHHRRQRISLTALVGFLSNPQGYGRIVRDEQGGIRQIVEEKDADEKQRKIEEVNAGTYCVEAKSLFQALTDLGSDNAQGEYYLTDLVGMLAPEGVETFAAPSAIEFMGINDRTELAGAEAILQRRFREDWMRRGVTMQDPSTVYLDATVTLAPDILLEPLVTLRGGTCVGEGSRIATGCVIEDSVLGEDVLVQPYSVILKSRIGPGTTVGPFAHLRPASHIGSQARVGNFVEVKNTRLGDRSKAPHLSYLGDAEIGNEVNIGAGTITCNYDGISKHRTVIEDGVFVGSDTQFVAPVRVGKGALVGAGSTITRDVPQGALAVARKRQVNLKKRAPKRLQDK
jgi:bifunctional UDP-N-acetylglucosamine pyrophosphorylase/glucosamine-1-phosphate N-acetyltransferase